MDVEKSLWARSFTGISSSFRKNRLNNAGLNLKFASIESRFVRVSLGSDWLEGVFSSPDHSKGIIVFIHDSGSSHRSLRSQYIAHEMQQAGLATMVFNLITLVEGQEQETLQNRRYNIELLAERTVAAIDWLRQQSMIHEQPCGLYASSTASAAALMAASERPLHIKAVVSHGGRPDLAGPVLPRVAAPVLFIVGGLDSESITLNQSAVQQMRPRPTKRLVVIPGATHRFEEPGALEIATQLARDWFQRFLTREQ
jgi:putative phosphoribosyl transferase